MGSAYAIIIGMAKRLISASLALAALTDACNAVKDAEHALTQARQERDELIRDAREAKIPYSTIMVRTRLSKDRLINIARNPRVSDYDSPDV